MPDLSFSELSFLKSKREKLNDSIKATIEKSRLRKDNDWDAGAHMSTYFASRKLVDQRKCPSDPKTSKLSGRATLEREYSNRGQMEWNLTPSEFVNISERPCHGLGSSRVGLKLLNHNIELKANLQSPKPLSTRPASLVSWSVSGVPSHHDPIDRYIKNSSDDVSNACINMKNDHQASVTRHSQQKPYNSVLPRRKVIHSGDTSKISKFDEQQEEPPGFMAGSTRSKTTTTDCAGVPQPCANGRGKRMSVKELVLSGQEDSPNQEFQIPFDATPENCQENCISTTHSPYGSFCSRAINTACLSEKLENVPTGNPMLLSQVSHDIKASTTECVYKKPEALHKDFFEPHLIPRTRSFEIRTDQPKEQLKLGLIDHGLRINQYNNLRACRLDRSEGLDRLSIGLSNHEFCTTDASNNHDKQPQHGLHMKNLSNGGCDEYCHQQLGYGCSKHTNRLAGLQNLEECMVACNPGNSPSHELGGIDHFRNDNFYGRNDNTEFFEELSNSYDEQKIESAIHEREELPSHHTAKDGMILDAYVREDEPLLQENLYAGYYSLLEDSYENPPNPELGLAGWSQNTNGNDNEMLPRDKYYFEGFLPWYDNRSGAGNIVDTRQKAMLQPSDELSIPGFWKPQKLY